MIGWGLGRYVFIGAPSVPIRDSSTKRIVIPLGEKIIYSIVNIISIVPHVLAKYEAMKTLLRSVSRTVLLLFDAKDRILYYKALKKINYNICNFVTIFTTLKTFVDEEGA